MLNINRNAADVMNSKDQVLLAGARLDSRMIGDVELDDLKQRFPKIEPDMARIELERTGLFGSQDYKIKDPENTVVVLWSGGLDSTGVVGNLLKQGKDVQPVYLASRHGPYLMRELHAQVGLWHAIRDLDLPGYLYPSLFKDMLPIMDTYRLSADIIPNRNELFVQYAATVVMPKVGTGKLGTGEYTGAEHWVVGWHVPVSDCEISSFETWLQQYLPPSLKGKAEIITLDNFGPSHVKARRLKRGIEAVGTEVMTKTTCCLSDTLVECGMCYCCVERAAAFHMLGEVDNTRYMSNPKDSWLWPYYIEQMSLFPA